MSFRIAISKYFVFALMSFFLSALIDDHVGRSSDFRGFKNIAAREVLLSLPEVSHKFVQSVGFFRTILDCAVSPLRAFFINCQFVQVDCLYEACAGWHTNNAVTGELRAVHSRSICG